MENFRKKMKMPFSLSKLSPRLVVLLGCLSISASAMFFYISTVFVRWAKAEVAIDASFFVFFRFMLGFLIICASLSVQRKGLKALRYDLLIGRAVFNCIAVFCFYKAVVLTTLAEGNILNMTYPIFIAVFSWVFLKEQRDSFSILMAVAAFSGIWLILSPEKMQPDINNLWGLMSGMSASAALLYLNFSRQYHDTETILFYMFGLGSVIMYVLFHKEIFVPNAEELYYLMLCALFGVAGQYLLTVGFRYVTAVEGAIISSSRILMAAVLGPWIAFDPPLSISGWAGAMLILMANVVLALRKTRKT